MLPPHIFAIGNCAIFRAIRESPLRTENDSSPERGAEKYEVLRKKKPQKLNRFIFSQDNVSEAKLYEYTASRKTRSIAEKETTKTK